MTAFDDGIGEDDEFPGDGDDSQFVWLTVIGEALVEDSEGGIASNSCDGGHVEGGAHTGATATDVIAAL